MKNKGYLPRLIVLTIITRLTINLVIIVSIREDTSTNTTYTEKKVRKYWAHQFNSGNEETDFLKYMYFQNTLEKE